MPIRTAVGKWRHRTPRASWAGTPVWLWSLGALPLLVLALVAGLTLSGAAAPRELIDPGPLVRWGLPLTTSVTRVAATVTIGSLILCALVLPRTRISQGGDAQVALRSGETSNQVDRCAATTADSSSGRPPIAVRSAPEDPAWRRAANIAAVAAAIWALAQFAHLILTHVSAFGGVTEGPSYGAQLAQFVRDVDLGRYLGAATLLVAILALLAAAVSSYASAAWATILALVALAPVSVTGHAAGAANHDFAVTSWWLHVGAVAVWAGSLGVLCVVASRLGPSLADVAQRFSRIALWAFGVTVIAGVANAWLRFSTPLDLFLHPYGQLLLIKTALTLALGLAGWAHRRMTIPSIQASVGPSRNTAGWAFWRLVGVEVLIMGAVIGVAVALGSSAPPEPQEPPSEASLVYLLTGYPQPPAPTVLTYLSQWRLDPLTTLATVAALVVYLSGLRRLRRSGHRWTAARTVSWMLGVLLFFWSTNGGPGVYGSVLFSAHMGHHLLLAVVVPVLLVLGAPVTLAMRVLSDRTDGSRGPKEYLVAIKDSPAMTFLAHPVVATANLAVSLTVFYYTPLFALAQDSPFWHALFIVYFTAAGCLATHSLLAPHQHGWRSSVALRLLSATLALAFYAVWGLALVSSSSLLAADHFGQLGLSWGVDALTDQRAGGLVTWGIGEISMVALAIAVIIAWARVPDLPAPTRPRR